MAGLLKISPWQKSRLCAPANVCRNCARRTASSTASSRFRPSMKSCNWRHASAARRGGSSIGVYPETKHPAHFAAIGCPWSGSPRCPAAPRLRGGGQPGLHPVIRSGQSAAIARHDAAHPGAAAGTRTGRSGEIAKYADGIGIAKSLASRGHQAAHASISRCMCGPSAPKMNFFPRTSASALRRRRTEISRPKSAATWTAASTDCLLIFPRSACACAMPTSPASSPCTSR